MSKLIIEGMEVEQLAAFISDAVAAQFNKYFEQLQDQRPTEFLSRKETAKLLGVSLVTLHDLTQNGTVPGYRIGSLVRYKRHEVEKALQTIKTGRAM